MPCKPIELPPAVARAFVADMVAFFAETDPIKHDPIAAEQMTVLQKYQGPREKPLRLIDVKEMFSQLWDES
jgi:hypothetical protein